MSVQSFQLASARKLFEAGLDGLLSAVSGVRVWSETEITTSNSVYSFMYYRYYYYYRFTGSNCYIVCFS